MKRQLAAVSVLFSAVFSSHAVIIFSQDFNSGTSLSTYVNATKPDSGQWNSIFYGSGCPVSIVNERLRFARSSGNGAFSRTTDFTPEPLSLIYTMDLEVVGYCSDTSSAAVFQVGSGFSTGSTAENIRNVHSRIALNLDGGNGMFSFRDPQTAQDSFTFVGRKTLTWVINNSGSTLSYEAPNHTSSTVANDTWDLWVGNSLVFNDRLATTGDQPLTDLKFAFTGGAGTIELDNISIQPVPEPASGVVVAGFLALLLVGRHAARMRRRTG